MIPVTGHMGTGKKKPSGDRRFYSLVPFTRVPFWVRIFDPYDSSMSEKELTRLAMAQMQVMDSPNHLTGLDIYPG